MHDAKKPKAFCLDSKVAIENLSVVWPIGGDDNNDGSVSVRYRASGQTVWIESAPLRPKSSKQSELGRNKPMQLVFLRMMQEKYKTCSGWV